MIFLCEKDDASLDTSSYQAPKKEKGAKMRRFSQVKCWENVASEKRARNDLISEVLRRKVRKQNYFIEVLQN